jgi:hypothetical protein
MHKCSIFSYPVRGGGRRNPPPLETKNTNNCVSHYVGRSQSTKNWSQPAAAIISVVLHTSSSVHEQRQDRPVPFGAKARRMDVQWDVPALLARVGLEGETHTYFTSDSLTKTFFCAPHHRRLRTYARIMVAFLPV